MPYWKISVLSITRQRGSLILAKFSMKTHKLRIITVKCENFQTLKIQDGGRSLSLKWLYRHISVKYQILMKF